MVKGVFLVVFLVLKFISTESCVTPDSHEGICIFLEDCPAVLNVLQTGTGPEAQLFFQRSQCGYEGTREKVCCATENNITVSYIPPNRDQIIFLEPRLGEAETLIPIDECGIHSENKIIGGKITAIDEYPWMALLKYNTTKGLLSACGGVLISRRYVLTAAHCIEGTKAKSVGSVVAVTLGEYDLETVKDCDYGYGVPVCNEAIDVAVEEIIVHEDYMPPPLRKNDIALIRLAKDVLFTNFIVPICLPDKLIVEKELKATKKMVICGWGQYKKNEPNKFSNIKRKAIVPVVDKDQCTYIYARNKINLEKDKVICAGGEQADSCPGDSGGPLMVSSSDHVDSRYYVMGLVSFGPVDCGIKGVPAIYTNVYKYLDWIMSKLRK